MVEHELDCDGRRLQQYTYIQLLRWPVPFHRILHFIFISGFLFICFSIFICSFSFFSQMRKKKSKKKDETERGCRNWVRERWGAVTETQPFGHIGLFNSL
jgi:hypothetical protein